MISSLILLFGFFGGNVWAWMPIYQVLILALLAPVALMAMEDKALLQQRLSSARSVVLILAAYAISAAVNGLEWMRMGLWAWCVTWWAAMSGRDADDYAEAAAQAGRLYLWIWPVQKQIFYIASPNIQAAWLALFAVANIQRGRTWWGVALSAAVLATGSRSALVAVLAGWVVMYWPAIGGFVRRWWAWGLPAAAGALPALVLLRSRTVIWRVVVYRKALEALRDHWLLGVGPGKIAEYIAFDVDGRWLTYAHGHNIILSTWLETGLVGLALFGLAVWLWVREAWPVQRWVLASLVILGVCGIVDDSLFMLGLAVYASGLVAVASKKRGN